MRRKAIEFRLVIDTIPAMAWVCFRDGSLEFLNRRWLDYTGLSMQEAVARPAETIHPEDRPRVLEKWNQILVSREPYEDEMRLRRADGEYRWFLVRTVPLLDEKGKIVRWYGTSTDIEDRKRAEEALRRSQRLFREAEELGHTGSWEHDLVTGRIFNTEENLRLFFGDDPSKGARFEDYMEAIHPDDRAYVATRHEQLLAEGGPPDIEFRVVWPNGSVHALYGRATVVRDASGQPARVYGTNVETTERKRAEGTAREGQELLRLLLATLPVGVAMMDREGDLVLANEASKHIWGADIIVPGRERWAQSKGFWHDSGKRIAQDEWASVHALSDGRTSLNELIDIETFDGKRKTIQNSSVPIRNAEGEIVGAVVVNEDVTERIGAEGALRESARRLQHLSRRLLAVQEEERRHLSRELHDEFGQVLAAISLHLQAAKSVAGQSAQANLEECMVLLQGAGARVRGLALELRPTMLDTAGLDATLRWLAEQHEQRTGIVTRVVGHLHDVTGDLAIACFRVVQEALTNVVRHARAQHVWIELSQSDRALNLVVRDDGAGFDVARTLEKAANEGRLGLLGMRERVQILGGSVEVDSKPEGGTSVRISLPLAEASEAAALVA